MRARALAALGLGLLALGGCSVRDAGQAAVADTFRISQASVDDEVGAVLAGLGQPTGEPPPGLALAVTQRLVLDELFAQSAAEQGLSVTQSAIDRDLASLVTQYGGQQQLEQAALQGGVPARSLDAFVRSNLLFTALAQKADPTGNQEEQRQAGIDQIRRFSEAVDVQVAPRYGTWDDAALQIVPGSAVATPAVGASLDPTAP